MSSNDPFRQETSMSSRLGRRQAPAGCVIAFFGAFFTIFAVVTGGILLSSKEHDLSESARGAVVIGMLAFPIGFFVLYLVMRTKKRKVASIAEPAQAPTDDRFRRPIDWKLRSTPAAPGVAAPSAPMPLHPTVIEKRSSTAGRVLLFAAVGIFWNGIVAVFLTQTGEGLPIKLFMIPFVIVGIGIIGGFIHAVLGLTNPSAKLTFDRTIVPLGGRVNLRYEFVGRTGAIKKLVVTLEGKEIAVYRRGTDTRTDRYVFWKSVVMETDDAGRIREGGVAVEIPTNAMHSFVTHHNTIEWVIRFHGTIPMWPDVNIEFPLTVAPHEQSTGESR